MSGGAVDRANAGFEDDRMSDDITADQATYDALVRDAILWRKGKAMRPDDMIVWEAWGMVQEFAQNNPACPDYFRNRAKEYQDRIAASRAVLAQRLYPNLEQPDTRDDARPALTASDAEKLILALDKWLDPNHGPSGYERTLFERCHALIEQLSRDAEKCADLAMMVRRLARALKNVGSATALADEALDLLERKGLSGNPLRDGQS